MNSIPLQRLRSLRQRIAAACVLLCALAIAPASNAQIYYSNVPDFYQHQKYGPGNNQIEDPDWEAGANNFGWCFYVSTVNQFFFFKKKGYNGLLNDDVAAPPPKWLPAVNDARKTIIKDFDSGSTLQKNCRDTGNPLLQAPINCILKDRGAGLQLGINGGLIHQFFEQSGADVSFKSSDGTAKTIPNTTLFAEMQKHLNAGDSVNLRVGHAKSNKLWWSGDNPLTTGNFHSVTVAGVDATAGRERILFADPDSNPDHNHASKVLVEVAWLPGNTNSNAGWYSTPDEANCGADGAKHTNLQCIRLRRFVGNEPVPVPASKPPIQKESDQRYFEAVMKAGLTSFSGKGAGFDRYDDTDIVGLNMIQVVKGAAKGRGASPGSGATFEVTPGD